MHINRRGVLPLLRYWKAVPTGISRETPGDRTVTFSSFASLRQISPLPSKIYQNSLTVACTVARLTWPGGTVLWIMFPVGPSIMN